jgi:hypothetical protein
MVFYCKLLFSLTSFFLEFLHPLYYSFNKYHNQIALEMIQYRPFTIHLFASHHTIPTTPYHNIRRCISDYDMRHSFAVSNEVTGSPRPSLFFSFPFFSPSLFFSQSVFFYTSFKIWRVGLLVCFFLV